MSNKENRIPITSTNQEKQHVYAAHMKKYNIARKYEFNFEALWILYAMLEARTGAFFYYLGFTKENERTNAARNRRCVIREIFNMRNDNDKYGFDKLGTKLDRMEQLFAWANSDQTTDDPFKLSVRNKLLDIQSDELSEAIDWLKKRLCDKRNQLVHALFNKKIDAAKDTVNTLLVEGEKRMRIIDNAVNTLKRHYKSQNKRNYNKSSKGEQP